MIESIEPGEIACCLCKSEGAEPWLYVYYGPLDLAYGKPDDAPVWVDALGIYCRRHKGHVVARFTEVVQRI